MSISDLAEILTRIAEGHYSIDDVKQIRDFLIAGIDITSLIL